MPTLLPSIMRRVTDKLGCFILARPMNRGAVKWLDHGHYPKGLNIKALSMGEVDGIASAIGLIPVDQRLSPAGLQARLYDPGEMNDPALRQAHYDAIRLKSFERILEAVKKRRNCGRKIRAAPFEDEMYVIDNDFGKYGRLVDRSGLKEAFKENRTKEIRIFQHAPKGRPKEKDETWEGKAVKAVYSNNPCVQLHEFWKKQSSVRMPGFMTVTRFCVLGVQGKSRDRYICADLDLLALIHPISDETLKNSQLSEKRLFRKEPLGKLTLNDFKVLREIRKQAEDMDENLKPLVLHGPESAHMEHPPQPEKGWEVRAYCPPAMQNDLGGREFKIADIGDLKKFMKKISPSDYFISPCAPMTALEIKKHENWYRFFGEVLNVQGGMGVVQGDDLYKVYDLVGFSEQIARATLVRTGRERSDLKISKRVRAKVIKSFFNTRTQENIRQHLEGNFPRIKHKF